MNIDIRDIELSHGPVLEQEWGPGNKWSTDPVLTPGDTLDP
jgi:hypothetical protein